VLRRCSSLESAACGQPLIIPTYIYIPSRALQTFLFKSNRLLALESLQMLPAPSTHLRRVCKSRSTLLFSTTLLPSNLSKIQRRPSATRLSLETPKPLQPDQSPLLTNPFISHTSLNWKACSKRDGNDQNLTQKSAEKLLECGRLVPVQAIEGRRQR